MRIVKPYGRSVTTHQDDGRSRQLRLGASLKGSGGDVADVYDIPTFTQTHDVLVMAQWVSVIDKIATKPQGNKKATKQQFELRDAIGRACWDRLIGADGALAGLSPDQRQTAAKIWKRKLHPYGDNTYNPKDAETAPRPQAFWFQRFCDGLTVDELTYIDAAAEVAKKIEEHLIRDAFRRNGGKRQSPGDTESSSGLIEVRARSIAKNVLTAPSASAVADQEPTWTDTDVQAYLVPGDPVAQIHAKVVELEEEGNRVFPAAAAEIFYAHYAAVFVYAGAVISRRDAEKQMSGVFALHEALRAAFTQRLKRHRKSIQTAQAIKKHGSKQGALSKVLPRDLKAALKLVGHQQRNRDLNGLIRLGKVIHHEASAGPDTVADIVANWPRDVTNSYYWTSDGQTEIKRTEAFVRAWRAPIAHAQRTLTDWVDPNRQATDRHGGPADMAGGAFNAVLANLSDEDALSKAHLLFGDRTAKVTKEDPKALLRLSFRGLNKLRNAAFHFKGMGGFVKEMTQAYDPAADANDLGPAMTNAHDLWNLDQNDRLKRVKDLMVAAHALQYLDQPQLDQVWELVKQQNGPFALPRFNRVIDRAQHAWGGLRLPKPSSGHDLEQQPARRCKYVLTKTIYERGFRKWIATREAGQLNHWIKRATDNTTKAAKAFHKKQVSEEELSMIAARATGLIHLSKGDGFGKFLHMMTALTTTEFRVQQGYQPNKEQAQEQASFLDDLHCDLVALAFDEYLRINKLDWLQNLRHDAPRGDAQSSDKVLQTPAAAAAQDWQALLYLVLHLVPADDVGRLLHRWRWWSTGYEKDQLPAEGLQLADTFELYLDMHDAKFDGAAAVVENDALRGLFDSDATRKRVFPPAPADDQPGGRRVMQRGLREMLRFGDVSSLAAVYADHQVTSQQVDAFEALGEKIAKAHKDRIDLRKKFERGLKTTKDQNRMQQNKEDLGKYLKAVQTITKYNRLSHHVTLTNHVRLHQIVMRVLGRLVDYVGLWERDVYFVLLAVTHLQGKTPNEIFRGPTGLDALRSGQIVAACRKLHSAYRAPLERHFGNFLASGSDLVERRNDLAHLNMMWAASRTDAAHAPLDLTEQVNRVRTLMGYDRKLKNAVSGSVKDLMAREKITMSWEMKDHQLGKATLKAGHIKHFKRAEFAENLHAPDVLSMVAQVFAGQVGHVAQEIVDETDLAGLVERTYQAVEDQRKRAKRR